jgi:hypothetical protein
MPRLTVRALAELMQIPGYEQYRVLYDQKYPRSGPNVFRTPYYAPALRGIRAYYDDGNSDSAIAAAISGLASLGNVTRRAQNERVLTSFVNSLQADRTLTRVGNPRFETSIGNTDLHISFDLVAEEDGSTKRILYNMRVMPVGEDLARTALEIAHWLLRACGVDAPMDALEYVDLAEGGLCYSFNRVRRPTIRRAEQTLRVVETLWPTI